MTFWDSFLFVVANVCRHLLRANLSKVPRNDTVVERVEHAEEASVHPGGGLHIEDQVEPKEGGHHGQVAKDANYIADFVYQQKPFINQSWSGALEKNAMNTCLNITQYCYKATYIYRLFCALFSDQPSDG